MINSNISLSSTKVQQLVLNPNKKLTLAMVVKADCYPDTKTLSTDTTLYDDKSSVSFNLLRTLEDKNYEVYPFPIKFHQNRITCRIFDNGVYSYPEYGREYPTVESSNYDETGGYYIKFNVKARGKIKFDSYNRETMERTTDYFLLNAGYFDYLIWFGNEGETPPLIRQVFKQDIRINVDGLTFSDQVRDLYKAFQSLGFLVDCDNNGDDYSNVSYLTIWKYSPFPAVAQSPLPVVVDNNLEYDIICSINNDKKVIDFYSKYFTLYENLRIVINHVLDKYHLTVEMFSVDGSIQASEFFICNDVFKSIEETLNTKSKLIGCKEYQDKRVLGEFNLKRTIEPPPITEDLWLESLQGYEIEYPIDIVIDSCDRDKKFLKELSEVFSDSLLFTINNYTLNSVITPFVYTDVKTKDILPGYLQMLSMISEKVFEGNLDETVTDLRFVSELNDTCNIPNQTNYEINLSQFITSKGYPVKAILGLVKVTHEILRLVDTSQNLEEFNDNLNLIRTDLRDLSFGTITGVEVLSESMWNRTIKATLQMESTEEIESSYLTIEITINIH